MIIHSLGSVRRQKPLFVGNTKLESVSDISQYRVISDIFFPTYSLENAL